jgi:hypothetical protein
MTKKLSSVFSRFSTAVTLIILTAVSYYYLMKEPAMPLVHKLAFPLLLSGSTDSSPNYLLPKGTSLYYDQAYPEGFIRYKIYVNVEGIKLESREATEKFWLDPLTAFPVDAEQLRKLLRDQPLSKDELASILQSGTISKADIRSLLEEYSH